MPATGESTVASSSEASTSSEASSTTHASDETGVDSAVATDIDTSSSAASETESESSTGDEMPSCGRGLPSDVLYTSIAGLGAPPDTFTVAITSFFDLDTGEADEAADDFTVPDGSCWCVTGMRFVGRYFGEPPLDPAYRMRIYHDGDELPGELLFEYEGAPSAFDESPDPFFELPFFDLTMAPTSLSSGRYWASAAAQVVGEARYTIALSQDGEGTAPAAQLDAEDCPEFTPYHVCYPDEPPVQLAFEVLGAEVSCER
ncbi:MAG TPA: hypothetical protein VG755_23760 [Nannocystaceae bacterium]|nr:hypothetical protein [Nannocystaceae bacterium]